jgi:hypothetical protein
MKHILPDEIVIIRPLKIVDMVWLSKQGGGAPQEWLSEPLQAGALDDRLNVLIFSGYEKFLAA